MKFLGMELYPKRKTDAEYVDTVRKSLSRSKWLAIVHIGMFGLFVALSRISHMERTLGGMRLAYLRT